MSGEPAIDPYDEESELSTERELAFMWLADLEARVADLEELLKMPGCLASPPDLETRVGDLEALTAMLLPTVWARNQPQLALSGESAQTEGGSG